MSIILDIEILCCIVRNSPEIWKSLLYLPYFGRWTLTPEGKRQSKNLFKTVHVDTELEVICWYYGGRLHRTNGPAVIWPDAQYWYKNGKEIQHPNMTEIKIDLEDLVDI